MYAVILLKDPERYARESWEQVPDLVEYEGASYSLRAGPRQPLATTGSGTRWRCMPPMSSPKRNSRTCTRRIARTSPSLA